MVQLFRNNAWANAVVILPQRTDFALHLLTQRETQIHDHLPFMVASDEERKKPYYLQ